MRRLYPLTLAALLALTAAGAQARPVRASKTPPPNPAIVTREAAMKGFATRMNRLDALMGAAPGRARSASAEP